MIKKSKLLKQLIALVMMLAVFTAVTVPIAAQADTDYVTYTFKIPTNQNPGKYERSQYRDTDDTRDAWKVSMSSSGELNNNIRTVTVFYLGVVNPNGYNSQGSPMYKVILGESAKKYPAYSGSSYKDVLLYGRNDKKVATSYTVSGKWCANTGSKPSSNIDEFIL